MVANYWIASSGFEIRYTLVGGESLVRFVVDASKSPPHVTLDDVRRIAAMFAYGEECKIQNHGDLWRSNRSMYYECRALYAHIELKSYMSRLNVSA